MTNDKGQMTRLSGFTLIEMITVLTIIIIVLAIAIPVWNALMGGTNLASAQNQISSLLATARADAVYNRQTMGVCFFLDPKTQRTAMAEVQVQPLWNSGTASYTPQFMPTVALSNPNNGQVYAIEMVNHPDPNSTTNPPNYIFDRDTVLLPQGVGVVLNNNTYTYNQNNVWGNNGNWAANGPPMDRYVHIGCIMFGPDGTLASTPFAIPYHEMLSSSMTSPGPENLLCQRIGMYSYDLGSIASPVFPSTPQYLPLMSSVGLVIFDHDAYLTQHVAPTTLVPIANTVQFADPDLEISLNGAGAPALGSVQAADKFIEENWIDKNGTAFLVNPFNGSLMKAK
jgi:Tfp pilus assembly protein FimT